MHPTFILLGNKSPDIVKQSHVGKIVYIQQERKKNKSLVIDAKWFMVNAEGYIILVLSTSAFPTRELQRDLSKNILQKRDKSSLRRVSRFMLLVLPFGQGEAWVPVAEREISGLVLFVFFWHRCLSGSSWYESFPRARGVADSPQLSSCKSAKTCRILTPSMTWNNS